MKLLNNHYFSTLSCYNTRLLDSLQAKFLRLPSRSRPFILPCSCKFSVCPKNRVSVFRFMKKTVFFCISFSLKKDVKNVLWHIRASRAVACDNLQLRASAHHWHKKRPPHLCGDLQKTIPFFIFNYSSLSSSSLSTILSASSSSAGSLKSSSARSISSSSSTSVFSLIER